MPHVTTCSRCGGLYEESSEEAANAPDRICPPCWRRSNRVASCDLRCRKATVHVDQVRDLARFAGQWPKAWLDDEPGGPNDRHSPRPPCGG